MNTQSLLNWLELEPSILLPKDGSELSQGKVLDRALLAVGYVEWGLGLPKHLTDIRTQC